MFQTERCTEIYESEIRDKSEKTDPGNIYIIKCIFTLTYYLK